MGEDTEAEYSEKESKIIRTGVKLFCISGNAFGCFLQHYLFSLNNYADMCQNRLLFKQTLKTEGKRANTAYISTF